jgi:hypothetical protein
MRISIEGCRAAPHCQRKSQAMTDTGRSDSKCRGSNPAASATQSVFVGALLANLSGINPVREIRGLS